MNMNEKRLVRVIAEQMARIMELEDMLDKANTAFKELSPASAMRQVKK